MENVKQKVYRILREYDELNISKEDVVVALLKIVRDPKVSGDMLKVKVEVLEELLRKIRLL